MISVYKYWMPVASDEHFLKAEEIATIYNVVTEKGNPHSKLVLELLKAYSAEHEYPVCHYQGAKGYMTMVFPSFVYDPVMQEFVKSNKEETRTSIADKFYNFKIQEHGHESI